MRVYDRAAAFMADGGWHATPEIAEAIGKSVSDVHKAMTNAERYPLVEKGDIVLMDGHWVRLWRLLA